MRPDQPLDPPPQTVELRGGPASYPASCTASCTVSYTATGSGRPVVAIHGMPARGRDFRWLDAAFAGRVRFIRPDLPGFGATPAADHVGHTIQDLARVVDELCEALSLSDAVVLGHSLGGAIAVEAASLSARITALALVNSVGPIFHRAIFPRTYRVLLKLVDLHPMVQRLTLATAKPIAHAAGFSKRLSDEEMIRAVRTAAGFQPQQVEDRLSRLAKPVLVAWSGDDRAVEPRVSQALLRCAPNTKSVRFETGAHNLQSSRATELADAIVAWASRVRSP